MDVEQLNNKLVDQTDNIILVLEKLGFSPKDKGKYISCSNLDGDNRSAISILKSNLHYENFTRGKSGNLYTLVMDTKNISFPQALEYVGKCLGVSGTPYKHIHKPFGNFYASIISSDSNEIIELPSYSESILPDPNNYSYRFVKDGIGVDIQKKWGVRFSHEDDSILIPIRDIQGRLVGCKARANNDNDFSARWYAWQGYSKTSVVYGLDKNYLDIATKRTLFITESEKSVLQADDFGFKCICAIGGHNISDAQAKIIRSLMIDKVVVSFDSDICEEEIRYNCLKLRDNNPFINMKVGYLYGGLDKELKLSPTDCGRDVFKNLCKNNIHWLRGK